jgi:hypothetical protein
MVNIACVFISCRQRKTPERIKEKIRERKERTSEEAPPKLTRELRLRRRVGPK